MEVPNKQPRFCGSKAIWSSMLMVVVVVAHVGGALVLFLVHCCLCREAGWGVKEAGWKHK